MDIETAPNGNFPTVLRPLSRLVWYLLTPYLCPEVKILVLPGGTMPARKSKKAVGYDTSVRAIVSAHEMQPPEKRLRKTLFDFDKVVDPSVARLAGREIPYEKTEPEPTYRLDVGEMAVCGIGFATEMPFPLCYLTLCRSGMAARHRITVSNAPGTIDPDYRGEAGIILHNEGKEPFYIYRGMRIAQALFTYGLMPRFKEISSYDEFSATDRGAGGFGSTGFR